MGKPENKVKNTTHIQKVVFSYNQMPQKARTTIITHNDDGPETVLAPTKRKKKKGKENVKVVVYRVRLGTGEVVKFLFISILQFNSMRP